MAQNSRRETLKRQGKTPRLLNQREAAALVGVNENTFWRWVKAGRITGRQRNGRGRLYYDEDQVLTLRKYAPDSGPNGGGRRLQLVPQAAAGEQLEMSVALERGVVTADQAQALWRRGVVALVRSPLRVIAGGSPIGRNPFMDDPVLHGQWRSLLDELQKALDAEDLVEIKRVNTKLRALLARFDPEPGPGEEVSGPGPNENLF